ncbi:GspE/PulE family protein [Chloroflexota bacterium]
MVLGVQKKLGEMLVEGAFIGPDQLEQALEASRTTGRKLGEVLVEMGMLAPETVAAVLSFQLNVPVIDLKRYRIQPEAISLVPEHIARQHKVLPLSVDDDGLRLVMDDPQDIQLIDTLSALTGRTVKPVLPLYGGIEEVIESGYGHTGRIVREESRGGQTAPSAGAAAEPLLEPDEVGQASVVRAADMIITRAVRDRASDIHIVPSRDALKVFSRIDGTLHEAVTLPLGAHAALLSRLKELAGMNTAERRRPQDGQFTMRIGDHDVGFRVATSETIHGEMMVLRVLDKSANVLELSELGFQPKALQAYRGLLVSPFGMIMVSGPTGSGKTTTLYASLREFVDSGCNIVTIEDPIEYQLDGVNQIQLDRQADITLRRDGMIKAGDGITTPGDVVRNVFTNG